MVRSWLRHRQTQVIFRWAFPSPTLIQHLPLGLHRISTSCYSYNKKNSPVSVLAAYSAKAVSVALCVAPSLYSSKVISRKCFSPAVNLFVVRPLGKMNKRIIDSR